MLRRKQLPFHTLTYLLLSGIELLVIVANYDVLAVTFRGKQHYILYCCEKQAILKQETDFHQHWTDFFLLLVETLASKLVVEERASGKWKEDLLDCCEKSIASAQNEHVSVMAVQIEQSGKATTEMLECSVVRDPRVSNSNYN